MWAANKNFEIPETDYPKVNYQMNCNEIHLKPNTEMTQKRLEKAAVFFVISMTFQRSDVGASGFKLISLDFPSGNFLDTDVKVVGRTILRDEAFALHTNLLKSYPRL